MPSARAGMRALARREMPSRVVKRRGRSPAQRRKSHCSRSLGGGSRTVRKRRAGCGRDMLAMPARQDPPEIARHRLGGAKPGHSHAVNQVRHRTMRESKAARNFLCISNLRKIKYCWETK